MAELRDKIQEILDTDISPKLAMHGGGVEIAEVDEEKKGVKLRFTGMCVDCPMVGLTFDDMIESELRDQMPELGLIQVLEE